MADVLFYVQHLLGIGHLRRAAAVVRALDAAGLDTLLVSGGLPVPNLDIGGARLAQLPAIKSRDAAFSALVDADGQPLDETLRKARRDQLLALYREARPRVVIIEQFPFGRRQLRFELLPLIKAMRSEQRRPALLCSLRDIVNRPGRPEKADWMLEIATRFFDLVLVHGDPALVTLEQSFPEAAALAGRLRYTGYVVSEPPAAAAPSSDGSDAGSGEVLVSTGGGAVAEPVVAAALAARPLSPLAAVPWRILAGDNMPEAAFQRFRAAAPEGVTIERARPDFTALLARCRLSISQAGYNTVLEVLRAGPPAVLVPFVGAGESEQSLRAELLAARGLVSLVPEAGLDGPSLSRGIAEALAQAARRPPLALDADGAMKTAEIVRAELAIVPARA